MHKKTLTLTLLAILMVSSIFAEEDSRKEETIKKIFQAYEQELKNNPDDITLIAALGDAYYNFKSYRAATEMYLRVLQLDPNNRRVLVPLGLSFLFLNDLKKSREYFELAMKYQPDNPDIYAGFGRIAQLNYRPKEAEQDYLKALSLDPNNIAALAFYGDLKLSQKKYGEAQKIFEKLVSIGQNWAALSVTKAKLGPELDDLKVMENQGKILETIHNYQKLITQYPDYVELYLLLGDLYVRMERYSAAITLYHKGLAALPDSNQLQVAIAFAYIAQDRFEEANALLKEILQSDPNNDEAIAGLGRIALAQGDVELAESEFKKSLEINEHNRTALTLLANMYLTEQRYAEAEVLYEKLLKIDPQSSWIQESLDNARFGKIIDEIKQKVRHQEFGAAEKLYLDVLNKAPENISYYLGLGKLYMKKGRYDEAIALYHRGLKHDPQNLQLILALANAYLKARDLNNSELQFQAALEIDRANADAFAGLGNIAEIDGNVKEAESYYEKALRANRNNITALSSMGNLRMKQKRYKEAESLFKRILDLEKDSKWAQKSLIDAKNGPVLDQIQEAEKKANYSIAENLYHQLIAQYPKNVDYYLSLGNLYVQRKRIGDAQELYEKGLLLNPSSNRLKIAMASVYTEKYDLIISEEILDQVLENDPENADALALRGRNFELSGNSLAAERYYQLALESDARNISALSYLADLEMRNKNYAEAEKLFQRLQESIPNAQWIRYALQDIRYAGSLEQIELLENVENLSDSKKMENYQDAEKLFLQLIHKAPDNSDYYFRLGSLYTEMQRFNEAISVFQHGLRISPNSPNLCIGIGFAYIHKGEYESAKEEFLKVLEDEPNNPDAWAGLGRLAQLHKKFGEAENYYLTALESDPKNVYALTFLGEIKMQQEQYQEGKKYYERLLKIRPNAKWVKRAIQDADNAPQLNEIQDLLRNEQFEEAAEEFRALIGSNEDNEDYYAGLGNVYIRAKKYNKAIEELKKGLDQNPDSVAILRGLGIAYLQKRDPDHAQKYLQEAFYLSPNNAEVLAGLGRVEALNDNPRDAEDYYLESLRQEKNNLSALSFYGELLMKEKRYEEAREIYGRLLQIDPTESWVRRAWRNAENGNLVDAGNAFLEIKDYKQAKRRYVDLITKTPDNPDYYFLLGEYYVVREEFDKAIDVFQEGLKVNPNATFLNRAIGFSLLSKGDIFCARRLFRQLIEENPDDSDAWSGLARSYAMRGDYQLSEIYYAYAEHLDPKSLTPRSYFTQGLVDREYHFSAAASYAAMMEKHPYVGWISDGYYRELLQTRPLWGIEPRYYEEDQWDFTVDKWTARYQVYGFKSAFLYPKTDRKWLSGLVANEYYRLDDRFNDFTYYFFTIFRSYVGVRKTWNSYHSIDGRIGLSGYSSEKNTAFVNQCGVVPEPTLLYTYRRPQCRTVLGISSDTDLVARNFDTFHAKMVGRWYVMGLHEREVYNKVTLGVEGSYSLYNDYVKNRSQRLLASLQWRPLKFSDYLLFRYNFIYQNFDKVIFDYYSYAPQLVHHLQVELSYKWQDIASATLVYAHGWQNTRTISSQIIVLVPIFQGFFWDRRQYDTVTLNLTFKQCPWDFGLKGNFYRDSTNYTIWSTVLNFGWRL